MILYRTNDDENVINKRLVKITETEILLKGEIDLLNPLIPLKNYIDNVILKQANYCYIEQLKRYYFIKEVYQNTGERSILQLEIDVLETHKDAILSSYCSVYGKPKPNSYGIAKNVDTLNLKYSKIYGGVEFDKTPTLILSTIGEGWWLLE